MKRKALEPMHSHHVNVTPLIDVIMCLIIFFLLCGQFARDESKRVTLPIAELGRETDMEGRVMINLVARPEPDAPPEIFVGARPVTMMTLEAFLQEERRRNPEIKVMVRADQSLAYSHLSPILSACAQADIKSLNFSTRRPE